MMDMRSDNPDLFHALTYEDFGDYDMLSAFTTANALSFFREYGEEIDISRMREMYHDNLDLFYALINDPDNLLQDIGVESFRMHYQQAQATVTAIPEDDPYYGEYNAYGLLKDWVLQDGNSVDAESHDTSDCEDLEHNNLANRGAAAEGVMCPVGSVEYIQEVLLGCRYQIVRDKLLRDKLGDGFLKNLELISDTFTSDTRSTAVFDSTQQKVDETVAFLRESLQDYEHIKWMREFSRASPHRFMSQQRGMVRYESLLHSLHTIDSVNCILRDAGAYYHYGNIPNNKNSTMCTIPVTSHSQLVALHADQDMISDMLAHGDCPTSLGLTQAQIKQVENGTHQIDWSSDKK